MTFSLIPLRRLGASWLETDFEEEEVREVVKAMNADKVPGPNRFSMVFFQAC
jgi:hypothetical protein